MLHEAQTAMQTPSAQLKGRSAVRSPVCPGGDQEEGGWEGGGLPITECCVEAVVNWFRSLDGGRQC